MDKIVSLNQKMLENLQAINQKTGRGKAGEIYTNMYNHPHHQPRGPHARAGGV